MLEHEPEAIVHQATALAHVKAGPAGDGQGARGRRRAAHARGPDALLAAAREAGVRSLRGAELAGLGNAEDGRPGEERG